MTDFYLGTQRLALRLAESERELTNTQQAVLNLQQLLQDSNDPSSSSAASTVDGGATEELRTLQVVVGGLREEMVLQADAARAEKQRLDAALRESTAALSKEREALQRVRQELEQRPTREEYVAVRRQLKMVQKIAFNVQDEEEEDNEVFLYVVVKLFIFTLLQFRPCPFILSSMSFYLSVFSAMHHWTLKPPLVAATARLIQLEQQGEGAGATMRSWRCCWRAA